MMSDPYGDKPKAISEPNQWHEFKFEISLDHEVDWDKVDLKKWAHNVARYTALLMGKSTLSNEEFKEVETIKTYLMNLTVSRIHLATDAELHNMIDSFGDDTDDVE